MELLGGVAVVGVELVAGNRRQHCTLGETAEQNLLNPVQGHRMLEPTPKRSGPPPGTGVTRLESHFDENCGFDLLL